VASINKVAVMFGKVVGMIASDIFGFSSRSSFVCKTSIVGQKKQYKITTENILFDDINSHYQKE